jgi:hypothetical protein
VDGRRTRNQDGGWERWSIQLADVVLRWYWGPPLRDLYARFDPFPSTANRTGLILAVAAAAEREGFRFHLYGPPAINIAPVP